MSNKFDSRQSKLVTATGMIGSAANDTLDTVFPKINNEIAKLFEDRNAILMEGGTVTVNTAANSVTFSASLKLHLNSLVAGSAPVTVDLGATARTFTTDGRMLYAVVDRTAGTATVTADAATLPAVTSANQEVFVIAKRLGSNIYFRNGQTISPGGTARIGSPGSFVTTEILINNAVDPTKQIGFNAQGSTATKTTIQTTQTANRTLSLPDATDTLATLSGDEFLQTKRVGYSSANNTTATGSNATITSPTTGIVRLTNTALVSVSGITAGNTGQQIIIENQTTNPITINDQETTATAGNRIYTGINAAVVMMPNTAYQFTYDQTAARWMLVGAVAINPVVNYITYNDATAGTFGWAAYLNSASVTFTAAGSLVTDTAHGLSTGQAVSFTVITTTTGITVNTTYYAIVASSSTYQLASSLANAQAGTALTLTNNGTGTVVRSIPTTGTGGAPASTFTNSTTSPLRGTASYLWTKSANNRMGEGFSYSFSIADEDKGKVLAGTFAYAVSSGASTYADDDMSWFILDVTNSVLIPCTPYKLKNHTLTSDYYFFEFQSNYNSNSYRLICHTTSTSALAYTLKFDSFNISRQPKSYGSLITDPVQYVPVITGLGTLAASTVYYSKMGAYGYVWGTITVGTPTATEARISMPTGWVASSTLPALQIAGHGSRSNTGVTVLEILSEPSQSYFTLGVTTSTQSGFAKANGDVILGAGAQISFQAKVLLQGASSSQLMSSDAITRVIDAKYQIPTSTAVTAGSPINYSTFVIDKSGAVTTGASWKFTAPVPGDYVVSAIINTATAQALRVYKNGSSYDYMGGAAAGGIASGMIIVPLIAGDYIDIRPDVTSTTQTIGSVNVYLIQGPAQIAASETISVTVHSATGMSVPANAAWTKKTFDTIDKDSHGSWSNNRFTAPRSGRYMVKYNDGINNSSGAVNFMGVAIYKNGTSLIRANTGMLANAYDNTNCVQIDIDLLNGEYLECFIRQSHTAAITSLGTDVGYFSITSK